MTDASAFRIFERNGWQRAAAAYPGAFGGLTMQATEPLLDAVNAGPGVKLLDVATGPGYVAAAAAARGADVIGVDFASAMVEQARRTHPGIDFLEGDAEALPFDDESFDAAIASFGMLHFARPDQALTEMRRVLRRGGCAAFTVWAVPVRAVGFAIVLDAVTAHGSVESPAPPGPPFFRFSEFAECERALTQAGFASPTIIEVTMEWHLPGPEGLFEAMSGGAVRTAAMLNAQPPDARAAIRRAVTEGAARFARDGHVVLPMPCVLASAAAR